MKLLVFLLILTLVYMVYVTVHDKVIKIDLTPFKVRYEKLKTAFKKLTAKIKALISIFKNN